MLITASQRSLGTLRKGSKGPPVQELQGLLNRCLVLAPPLKLDGKFGVGTLEAVRAFQKKAELKIDGVVGGTTWTALYSTLNRSAVNAISTPQARLATIALGYLGNSETGNNRMGTNPNMREIFEADDLFIGKGDQRATDGYPWCAAFVSLCVQKLLEQSTTYASLKPPREPSVSKFLNQWAKGQRCLVFGPDSKIFNPAVGDIVVFKFSHIGIVEKAGGAVLGTIEGNTNDAGSREGTTVARKARPITIVRSFIRLPLSMLDDTRTKTGAAFA